jgi:hypothetical protein
VRRLAPPELVGDFLRGVEHALDRRRAIELERQQSHLQCSGRRQWQPDKLGRKTHEGGLTDDRDRLALVQRVKFRSLATAR